MADTNNLTTFLTDVAQAIKDKKGTTEKIPAANFDSEIASIETGTDTSDATAIVSDIAEGKTAYIGDGKITGTLPTNLDDYNSCLAISEELLFTDVLVYTPLNYIESTGTQHIDTGVKINGTITTELTFETVAGATGWGRLFGTSNDMQYEFCDKGPTTVVDYRIAMSSSKSANITINAGKRIIKLTYDGKVYVDNSLRTNLDAICNNNRNLLICSGYYNTKSKTRLYKIKIWSNDTLIRNMIPAKDASGVVCMYDKVDNKFYYNAGTGDFISGGEVR